jgi:pimeloyl-ACP methyl ester carboxylesterase
MDYDITAIKGGPSKPAVFFVHGLGMDKKIWESPDDSKILGGQFPIGLILARKPSMDVKDSGERPEISAGLSLGDLPRNLSTLFHILRDSGYTVITWSQKRPSARISVSVSELRDVVALHRKLCDSGIILIGHSRGGLVARAYVRDTDMPVRALITLAAPHRGSNLARWIKYVTPLVTLLDPLLSDFEKGTLRRAARRILDFLQSAAAKEFLPDSRFFKTLDDGPLNGIYYQSAGGSDPSLLTVYRTAVERVRYGNGERFTTRARKLFSVPDIFEKIIPESFFPDEMKNGRGDGLVSVESSRLPWADDHFIYHVNHAGILFDERVKDGVMKALEEIQ